MDSFGCSFARMLICKYVYMSAIKDKSMKCSLSFSLSLNFLGSEADSLLLQNPVLQASQVFPVTGHHTPLCGPWWNCCGQGSETGLSQVLTLAAPPAMLFPGPKGPAVLSAFLSFGEELLSHPVPWADVGTGSGCVFCSLAASLHRNLTKWKGNSTGNVAVLP